MFLYFKIKSFSFAALSINYQTIAIRILEDIPDQNRGLVQTKGATKKRVKLIRGKELVRPLSLKNNW